MKAIETNKYCRHSVFESLLKRLALLLAVGLSVINIASADTSVWVVTSGSNTVYLGGTVHLLRPTDYPLLEEFEQAYQASSEIYFETDLSSMANFSVQAQMLQQLTYTDERSLKTVLNQQAYSALSAYAAKVGLPLMMLEKFKPGMVISTLQIMEFQKMGFTAQGVDNYFNTRAIADAKRLGQLESIEQQIGFLAAMGEGNESKFILMSLRALEQTGAVMEDMIAAWRTGNDGKLAEMFVADMQAEAPELYNTLLLRRNLNWIPQIETMLRDADTEFVLVGAAHLVGNQGLLDLLSRKGFQIRQL
jgi:uncharacterized protein YbaP (TraB family)